MYMGNGRDVKIIYEDNHLLVVEKPQNILTQGDQTGDEDLLTVLKEDIGKGTTSRATYILAWCTGLTDLPEG